MLVKLLKEIPPTLIAYGGFQWPRSGHVECPDWEPTAECGHGLHALRWVPEEPLQHGARYAGDLDNLWMVIEVDDHPENLVQLVGKVKFHRGNVIYVGSFIEATNLVRTSPTLCGFYGTATAGRCSNATAGYRGTAIAGNCGTANAGHYGTANAGDTGKATAGDYGTATAGDYGTATVGHYGNATAGDKGTATAGLEGTATVGSEGTATVGSEGIAIAGNGGTVAGGDKAVIVVRDEHGIAYFAQVGVAGIKPNIPYTIKDGQWVEK